MPEFAYTARDVRGGKVSGVISAATVKEAASNLSAKELFPLQIEASTKHAGRGKQIRVKARAVAPVYNQLAALIRSGVPLLKAVAILKEQTSNQALSAVLEDVHKRVEEGATLADAMARHPRAFGDLAVGIVRAGGEGGFLEEALDRVASFTEQQDELKSRVVGALAYPVFLAAVGTIVVNVLVIFFVPRFESLFARLKERGELPVITEWLIAISQFLQTYGLFIVVGLVIAGYAIKARLATEEGKILLDRWRLRVPQVSSIYLSLAVARFCRVLGTLLAGGVAIVRSLEISAGAAGNRVLAAAIRDAAENISAGESLATPLAECGYFPRNVVEMIIVAEESNSLETVLVQIAESLERETWRRLDLFVRLLEPIMLLLLAIAVLCVVIALLLPVLKMSTAM